MYICIYVDHSGSQARAMGPVNRVRTESSSTKR